MSAPSVNQMRFFSSSALAIAPKLMLEAIERSGGSVTVLGGSAEATA
jgi:hypothetical protein